MTREELFGMNVRFYRKQNGWSQEKLAEIIGVSTRMVQQLESGNVLPSLKTLIVLSETFDTSMDDMLGIENPSALGLRELIGNMTVGEREMAMTITREISKLFIK